MTRLIPNPKTAAIASACALALSVGLVLTPPAALAQDNQYQADWLTLDGTNAMVVLPDERLALSGGGTLEFWAYPTWDASTEYDPVAVAYVSEDGPSYAISLLAQKDGLAILFGEEEELVLFDFSDGQAHHVAVSVYTDGTEVFINGEFVATFDMTPPAIEGAAFLIGSAVDNTDPFVGSIGAMRMWDVPLRPQYITNYRLRPLLSEELGDHPDIESLNAFSEFSEGDFFMVDSAEVE